MSTSPQGEFADREAEKRRYERYARTALAECGGSGFGADGAQSVPEELRTPYLEYEKLIRDVIRPGSAALDVCGGTGLHSLHAARCGAEVTITDISPASLRMAQARAREAGLPVRVVEADSESLPFPPGSFDLVTCAGGLSYVELEPFLEGVHRVLRPGGYFICVDSFNHNPIYRLNRYVHYLRGRRTRSTLERMPNDATLAAVRRRFSEMTVQYHGVFSFAVPLLRPCLGGARARRWLDWFDAKCPRLKRYSFKIVLRARR